jgi:predicted ATPase
MKIIEIHVRNFRVFTDLVVHLSGQPFLLVGENASGKTSLLEGIASALGGGPRLSKADFGDPSKPLSIEAVLGDLSGTQRAALVDEIDFIAKTLTVGIRAIWDSSQEFVEIVHGYPQAGWRKSTREQRDSLAFEWFPADRNAGKLLKFGLRKNLLARLLEGLPLEQSLDGAKASIRAAQSELESDQGLQELLTAGGSELAELIPNVTADAFALGSSDLTAADLLSEIEITLEHHGAKVAIPNQSSGLAHLALFSFAVQLLRRRQGAVLLIDEPEMSLHPQAQRALMKSLASLESQTIVATHSSNLLDRSDPRHIARLHRSKNGEIRVMAPKGLTDIEARKIARFSNPTVTESFFAQKVILVEGESDKLALEVAAEKLGLNLDGESMTIVSLEGAGGLKTFLKMLGTEGLGLRLAGLCDKDKEASWVKTLHSSGLGSGQIGKDMNAAGFFVSDIDLEDELLRALGEMRARQVITDVGDDGPFSIYSTQPGNSSKSQMELLHNFIKRGGRKVVYAVALTDELDRDSLPRPLKRVLEHGQP